MCLVPASLTHSYLFWLHNDSTTARCGPLKYLSRRGSLSWPHLLSSHTLLLQIQLQRWVQRLGRGMKYFTVGRSGVFCVKLMWWQEASIYTPVLVSQWVFWHKLLYRLNGRFGPWSFRTRKFWDVSAQISRRFGPSREYKEYIYI